VHCEAMKRIAHRAKSPIPDTGFAVAGTFGREITVDYMRRHCPSRTEPRYVRAPSILPVIFGT